MKWIALVLGVLAGFVAVIAIAGALRPADHVASLTFHLGARRDSVWATITDFTGTPQWFDGVRRSERIADVDGRPAWKEDFDGFEVTLVQRERTEGTQLVREILPSGSFSGTWTYDLADDGSGTRLTITERGHVGNPLFRGMMIFSDDTKTMRRYAAALGRKLGTSAAVVAQ